MSALILLSNYISPSKLSSIPAQEALSGGACFNQRWRRSHYPTTVHSEAGDKTSATFQGYQYLSEPLHPSLDLLSLAWTSDSEYKVAKTRTRPQPRSEGVGKHKALRAHSQYTNTSKTTWSGVNDNSTLWTCKLRSTCNLPGRQIQI